eukprot:COSAG02_NODE_46340_length_349_cov_2.268000_1_plen_50_part_10
MHFYTSGARSEHLNAKQTCTGGAAPTSLMLAIESSNELRRFEGNLCNLPS